MHDQDDSLTVLLDEIKQKHGDALLAILIYGSWLRGQRDTMLDFYVLVEDYRTLDTRWQGWMCKALPPNVYQIHHMADDSGEAAVESRAKYALLSLGRFKSAMQHDFHSYFWARFSQPCEIAYVRDQTMQDELSKAFELASNSFIRRVLPTMGDQFTSSDLWTQGLALTYQCELRTESGKRGESIYEYNSTHFDKTLQEYAALSDQLAESQPTGTGTYQNHTNGFKRSFSSLSWWLRRIQGKLLSVLRLSKAAFTFNQPLEYLLWKIERHTGLYIQPTQRQLKYPLIFSWPLLWKLYRKGAFR